MGDAIKKRIDTESVQEAIEHMRQRQPSIFVFKSGEPAPEPKLKITETMREGAAKHACWQDHSQNNR